jgi:hypothetical protein
VVAHPLIIGLLFLAILVPPSLGIHWHVESGQNHSHAVGAADHDPHPELPVDLALELTPSHLQAHFADGEFDVQPETSSPGKTAAVKVFVTLLSLAFGVLALLPGRGIVWPPLRPPRPRLNARFLPPSHAPPHAA